MHSDYSQDAVDSLEGLREISIGRGLSAVCLTEHAEDLDADTFAEYIRHCAALSDDAFSYIPGLEFRFKGHRGVHLLALGLREWFAPETPVEFFDRASRAGAFTILAHPIACRYAPPDVVGQRVDGIEVWNARYNTRFVPDPDAITLFRRLASARPELRATVGLDQHDGQIDGGVHIKLAADQHAYVIEALRHGTYSNVGRKVVFDARAEISEQTMRSLRFQRRLVDTATRVQQRITSIAHQLGLS